VVGLSAVRAVLEARPGDALNLAHARESRHEVAELLRLCAREHIAYRELLRDELDRLADTTHHEGVCLLAYRRRVPSLDELARFLEREGGFVVALDRVDNPHNIGAVLRSAAFFGARALLVSGRPGTSLTPASVRVAEGGAEQLPVLFVERLAEALSLLQRAGARIVAADGRARRSAATFQWPECSVLVLGNEREGISERVLDRCDAVLRIAGTGAVESLNVSVAAGILMASYCDSLERNS
jgi:TrmH RNA methyltransferase